MADLLKEITLFRLKIAVLLERLCFYSNAVGETRRIP